METISFDGKTYNLVWFKQDIAEGLNVTQVSGYIFNDDNDLLIVKVGKNWTIPGGHPEEGENPLDTLNREIIEEANIKIKDSEFMGYVEVTPEHDEAIHYQLRYKAKVDSVDDFKDDFESTERKFVKTSELKDYIKWFDSTIFQEELKAATGN